MTAQRMTIKVANIMEYPTNLGGRCMLLESLGLDDSQDSEEDLLAALTKSALDPDCLRICTQDSRCRAFWEAYQRGETPYLNRDPIKLSEYDGRYWVSEGNHRVCMAKRAGVETIEAYVYPLAFNAYALLQPEGEPGRYFFRHTVCGEVRQGEIAVLWADPPPGEALPVFSFFPARLDVNCDTGGVETELFAGLSYSVHCTSKRTGLLKRRTSTEVDAMVCITARHANTRIWLLKGSADSLSKSELPPLSALDTVFRCGCWRTRHLSRHVDSFGI